MKVLARPIYTILFLLFIIQPTFSQIATKKDVLAKMGTQLNELARSNFSEAIIKAKENQWSTSYVSKNNRTAKLIGLDKNGWPKYFITNSDPTQAITIGSNTIGIAMDALIAI